jgi:putative FmdB family regulatory protein
MLPLPIYEYSCRSCRLEFETLVRNGETPSCVHCASTELDKKRSVFAMQGEPAKAGAAPCGACGHSDGPGSCAIH